MVCTENNLVLNTLKIKELIIDYRRNKSDPHPIHINGDCVKRVSQFKFLGVYMVDDLSLNANTTALVKRAQQHLHILRTLRKNNLAEQLLVSCHCSMTCVKYCHLELPLEFACMA